MGFFDRLKKGLSKSRGNLTERVDDVLDGLRQRLPGADIRWWSEIVERFGRLA